MAAPTALDVTDFLGQSDNAAHVALAESHLPLVTAFVRAYTGGRGFDAVTGEPGDDIAAVIITATARLMMNPTHNVMEAVGPFTQRPGTLEGWTLPELAVLHRHRRRSA